MRSGTPDPLAPFQDRLEIPAVLPPYRVGRDGMRYYRVVMKPGRRRFHAKLRRQGDFWGYQGTYPGPTIEVPAQRQAVVEFVNALQGQYPFATDTDASGPSHHGESLDPAPRHWTVVHLHGSPAQPGSDGWSDDVFGPGGSAVCHYPRHPRGALLWYHDHANMITRLNVYAGLAGLYVVRGDEERRAGLPVRPPYELPLLIQDRNLEVKDDRFTGRLRYKSLTDHAAFSGDYTLVNGTISPYVDVRPRAYRLRLLNGSNGRVYRLRLVRPDGSSAVPELLQIGSDLGFLAGPAPADPVVGLSLAPAERADVLVDFRDYGGECLRLVNRGPENPVLEFRIAPSRKGRAVSLAGVPWAGAPLTPRQASLTRQIVLIQDEQGRHTLNGRLFHDGVEERPYLGAVEIWEFINLTGDVHPMHLHLVEFRVLNRQALVAGDPGTVLRRFREWQSLPPPRPPLPEGMSLDGPELDPPPAERGPKDTVLARPDQVTRVIARFGPHAGKYMYHCHILEHEDMDMMRPFVVIPPGLGHPGGTHGHPGHVHGSEE